MEEHPVDQPIDSIVIDSIGSYTVGRAGVTRIEACQKSGMHANIPYVRVWIGEVCVAEFCQHNIVGVYFDNHPPKETEAPDFSEDRNGLLARFNAEGVDNFNDEQWGEWVNSLDRAQFMALIGME